MDETFTALATTGATTIVAAMATDAWHAARAGIARIFGRSGAGKQAVTEAQLDEDAEVLSRVEGAEVEQARADFAAVWRRRLGGLLTDHPELAEELKTVIEQIAGALPQARQSWVQNIIAAGPHSHASGAMFGNVYNYQRPNTITGDAETSQP